MANIVVFGGTFNPIHLGHIQMLEALSKIEDFDKILVIPAKIPPHKTVEFLASDSHRLQMCALALKNLRKTQLCDIELNCDGISYTYNTVRHLKKLYPGDNVIVACGGDMAVTLDSWYEFDSMKKICQFAVIRRIGIDEKYFANKIDEIKSKGAIIRIIDADIQKVSSSQIRECLSNGLPLDGMLSESIIEYINTNNVYG